MLCSTACAHTTWAPCERRGEARRGSQDGWQMPHFSGVKKTKQRKKTTRHYLLGAGCPCPMRCSLRGGCTPLPCLCALVSRTCLSLWLLFRAGYSCKNQHSHKKRETAAEWEELTHRSRKHFIVCDSVHNVHQAEVLKRYTHIYF